MESLEKLEILYEQATRLMYEGQTKTLVGKYPTGEDKYSYDLDNAKIGAAVRAEVLALSQEMDEVRLAQEQNNG